MELQVNEGQSCIDVLKPFILYNSYKPTSLKEAREYTDFVLSERVPLPNYLEELSDGFEEDITELRKVKDYDFMATIKTTSPIQSYLKLEQEKRKDQRMRDYLWFDSLFECGNLNKVVAISPTEYNLYLNTDTNSPKQSQWFYFAVSNTKQNVTVKFNIVNQTKQPHFYKKGMKPLVFSKQDYNNIYAAWTYHVENLVIVKSSSQALKIQESYNIPLNNLERDIQTHNSCYSVSFTYTFKHDNDKAYFAYNKPYSFTRLNKFLKRIEQQLDKNYKEPNTWILPETEIEVEGIFYKREILCNSLAGLPLYAITITNTKANFQTKKRFIIITARVHASETPGSCKVQGILKFLLSNNLIAEALRNELNFLIIPMLNPDGVIFGNNRCSLGGYDLNRCWGNPSIKKHPTVYAIKQRMQQLVSGGNEILVFCDLHGHSKLLNSFMYACNKTACGSLCFWTKVRLLPRVLASKCYLFDYHQCSFKVEPEKVNTARVIVWKEFKVTNSFTLESSMFAYMVGEEMVMFQERDYARLGEALMNALNDYLKLETHMQEVADGVKAGRLIELIGVPAADLLKLEIQEYKIEEKKRERVKFKAQKASLVLRETQPKTPILNKQSIATNKYNPHPLNSSMNKAITGNKCTSNKELLIDKKTYEHRNKFAENYKSFLGGIAAQTNINLTQYPENEEDRKTVKKKSCPNVYITDVCNKESVIDAISNYKKCPKKTHQPSERVGNKQQVVTNGMALKTSKRPVSSHSKRQNIFKRFIVNAKDITSTKLRNTSYIDSRKVQRNLSLNFRGDKINSRG